MASLAGARNGATLVAMRRGILCVLLVSGCFAEEPEPVDKIDTPMTTAADEAEESSSSESTASGSSSEESSSEGYVSPYDECPEWCNRCDTVQGVYTLCRCLYDTDCMDGMTCHGAEATPPDPVVGHCM